MTYEPATIFHIKLTHTRLHPVLHAFTYPIYMCGFDLDQLSSIENSVRGFSYNKKNILSLWDKDYLTLAEGSIRDKLVQLLKSNHYTQECDRIILITSCRYLAMYSTRLIFTCA